MPLLSSAPARRVPLCGDRVSGAQDFPKLERALLEAASRAPNLDGLEGIRLDRATASRLLSWLDELSASVEASKVDLVLLDSSCDCAASERRDESWRCLRVLYLGLPVLEMFEQGEL